MSDDSIILSPVGRIVQGDLWEPQQEGYDRQPPKTKSGKPKITYYVGLAISHNNAELPGFIQRIKQDAAAVCLPGRTQREPFAWKYFNGDEEKWKDHIGFPGHTIFRLTNGFPPKVYITENGKVSQIAEPERVKRGYFIKAAISIASNGETHNAGIFLNLEGAQFIAYGEPIIKGAILDADKTFGGASNSSLPPGASLTPVDSSTPVDMGSQQSAAPSPPPPPANDFVEGPPRLTPKANGHTYEEFIGNGWTKETLIQHGYMIDDAA